MQGTQQSNDSMGPPAGMMSPQHNSNSMDGFSGQMRITGPSAMQSNQQIMMTSSGTVLPAGGQTMTMAGQPMAVGQPMGVPLDPLFVAPPPKTHKAMHSEIYVRYIENLAANRPTLTDFHSTLTPRKTPHIPAPPNRSLPTHWFKDGVTPAHQASVTEALWSLRDYMLKDALTVRPGPITEYHGPL